MHESTKLSRPDGTPIGFEARKSWLLSTLVLPAHPSIRAKALVDFKGWCSYGAFAGMLASLCIGSHAIDFSH